MKNEILQMNQVWENMIREKRDPTQLPHINFEDLVSEIFAVGPFYYYLIDFFDLSISHISQGFREAHGVEPRQIKTVNEILEFIHPDDLPTVVKAEEMALSLMKNSIGMEKIKEYKVSYNFRFKTATGNYQLYNHQALVLTTDVKGNFGKSLNIHTNINHLTSYNNKKLSLIGLSGHPSFLNLDIYESSEGQENEVLPLKKFSVRELQIIKMIAGGMDNNEIAAKLFISVSTVKSHRKNILAKSGCKNTIELVVRSTSEGWI